MCVYICVYMYIYIYIHVYMYVAPIPAARHRVATCDERGTGVRVTR